jgi:hypothetical protein
MLRSIAFIFLMAVTAMAPVRAAIWPEQLGTFTRGSTGPAPIADKAVWDEYGLQESEQASFSSGSRKFTAEAYRLKDPTGAMAVFQWQRPAAATKSNLAPLAAQTPAGVVFAFHNYFFRLEGYRPSPEELAPLLSGLPRLDQGSLPALMGYLPKEGLLPNSERFVLGPVSLEKFEPRILPSVAAFHLGTEVQLGKFTMQGREMTLAVLSYPTPNLARDRVSAFSGIPNAVVKRSGPLLAVIVAPPNADDAERLLAKVQYQASITWNERTPTARDNIGNLIINVFNLAGLLLLFCAGAGLAFGCIKYFSRRFLRRWIGDDGMIQLHLADK